MRNHFYLAVVGFLVVSSTLFGSDTGRLDGKPRPDATTVLPLATGEVVERPADFGPAGDTVTTFYYSAFQPVDSSFTTATDGQGIWAATYSTGYGSIFHATLQLPEGAVVDKAYFLVCQNNTLSTPLVVGVARDFSDLGDANIPTIQTPGCYWVATPQIDSVSHENTGHVWVLFFNWLGGALDGSVKVKQAEVWWHRSVSAAPLSADFLDVPVSDPRFAFIEALYQAGITAGCGGGYYCPDEPLTRGQIAVFLSKALGLYWPNASPPQ
jgi:S-layer homology domain